MRVILSLTLLLMLALATPAAAQEPTPTAAPGCERGAGTDADYAYCPDPPCRADGTDADYVYSPECCREEGTDADYVYGCPLANSGGPPQPAPERDPAVQPLAANTLPVTGGESWLVALAGFALLLCGLGIRMREPLSGPPAP